MKCVACDRFDAPDMIIDDLFESLYSTDEKKSVSYGKELQATESQTKALVALSHLFPSKFTKAIDLIETGSCEVFTSGDAECILVDNHITSLNLWACQCNDYLRQLVSLPKPELRWQRVCKHLLAAFIIERKYPILDYSVVQKNEIGVPDMVQLHFHGTRPAL